MSSQLAPRARHGGARRASRSCAALGAPPHPAVEQLLAGL